jgi:hypothetical protein
MVPVLGNIDTRCQWRDVLNTVMNLQVKMIGEFLNSDYWLLKKD